MLSNSISPNKNECNYLDVARFIGIYLVILGHFAPNYPYNYLVRLIFSFHMPLFFVISGILHRPTALSRSSIWKLFYSLIIPYLLYNLIGAIYLLVQYRDLNVLTSPIISTLIVETPITVASWFLVSLFWVKLFCLIFNSKQAMIIFSIVCIGVCFAYDLTGLKLPYDNIFKLRTSLASFPFFTLGYLVKDFLISSMKTHIKLILSILALTINFALVYYFSSTSLAEMLYENLFFAYFIGTIGSLAILYLSQVLLPYIRCNFVKDISRGTMIIVGLHFFVMYNVLSNYIHGIMPFRYTVLWSIAILLFFYVLIKLTYNKIPILYGK